MRCIVRSMSGTSKYDLVDRIVGGTLTADLHRWRTEGLTYESISRKLAADNKVDVSAATIHRWMARLEAEGAKA